MLAHWHVKFSTFPAELHGQGLLGMCNVWLQCRSMRIELPSASWADTAHRADDDAHTMTVATPPTTGWADLFSTDTLQLLRTQVEQVEPLPLTITF
jgi:hypothetical protein